MGDGNRKYIQVTSHKFRRPSGEASQQVHWFTRTCDWSANLDWSGESTRKLYLSLPENNDATGTPMITSSAAATVGDVLSTDQGNIADSDVLPTTIFPDGYTLQWLREDGDGSNQQLITGQTSETYTLTNDVENGLLSAALELGWSIRSVSDQDDVNEQQQAIAEQNDGGGAELAGRLHWLNADGSLSATVDTRVLLGGRHHREWGIGGHLRFTPSRWDGEGLSLTLQPSFGVTGTRLDELWSLAEDGDPAINNDRPSARLDARLAYGFPLGNNAILTPCTELTWEETANTCGAGLRYHLNPFPEPDLKGARRNRAHGNPENRLFLDMRSDL